MYQRGSHRTDFREICIVGTFMNNCQKYTSWLKSGKHIVHFLGIPKRILLLPATLNRHKSASSGMKWHGVLG